MDKDKKQCRWCKWYKDKKCTNEDLLKGFDVIDEEYEPSYYETVFYIKNPDEFYCAYCLE